jgi:hypothetical protein
VKLEDYRALFMVATLGCALVVTIPAIGLIVPSEGGSESFSELWLLGSNHLTTGYPFNVGPNEECGVFVGVGNHIGDSQHYRVYVKFSNGSSFLPDVDAGMPSVLSPLYEFRFFVDDGGVWESAVSFWFEDVAIEGDVLVVGDITINGVSFPVDVSTVWDPENEGYFFELFFELWRYDVEYNMFKFDDRFVGLRLNMTSS